MTDQDGGENTRRYNAVVELECFYHCSRRSCLRGIKAARQPPRTWDGRWPNMWNPHGQMAEEVRHEDGGTNGEF